MVAQPILLVKQSVREAQNATGLTPSAGCAARSAHCQNKAKLRLSPAKLGLRLSFVLCIRLTFLEINEIRNANKLAKNIILTKVGGVLKTSFQWLFNGVKQTIPRVIFYFIFTAQS